MPSKAEKKEKKIKPKRQLTEYNIFLRENIALAKKEKPDENYRIIFKEVVNKWNDQKKNNN